MPVADRAHAELSALKRLRKKNPLLFYAIIGTVLFFSGFTAHEKLWGIAALERRIEEQRLALGDARSEIILLETRLAPFKTYAVEKYGGEIGDALIKLAADLRKIEAEIQAARSMSASVEIKVAVNWKEGIPDHSKWLWFGGNTKAMSAVFVLDDGREAEAEFHNMEGYDLKGDADGVTLISYRATASPGSPIFGESPARIRAVKDFSFSAVGLSKEQIPDEIVRFRNLRVTFFVNGRRSFHAEAPVTADLKLEENSPFLVLKNPLEVIPAGGLPSVKAKQIKSGD